MANTPVVVLDDTMTSIANAIRGKNGSQDTYKPGEMPAAITAIPTGGGVTVESLSVTQNGTYQEEGKAYSPVVVNVPTPAFTISPSGIALKGINGAVEVKPQVTIDISSSLTSMENMFRDDTQITSIEFDNSIDLSNVTRCDSMCNGCSRLAQVSFNNSFAPTNISAGFVSCYALSQAPNLNLSNCTNITQIFASCNNIQYPYVYDLSGVTNKYNFQNSFNGNLGRLTQQSVDNLLQSFISLGATQDKKLTVICGYSASTTTSFITKVQASPYYQAFLDAGWTIE